MAYPHSNLSQFPDFTSPPEKSVSVATPLHPGRGRLEVALQHERCLNRLGDRLNAILTEVLRQGLESARPDEAQVEQVLLHSLAEELQSGLTADHIALALANPAAPDASASYTIQHVVSRPLAEPSQQLQTGQVLTVLDLQAIDAQGSIGIWQLMAAPKVFGWLLISLATERSEPATEAANRQLIERGIYQTVTALQQIRLIWASGRQRQQLLMRTRELEETNQRKSEFLANTSHEIRTPLSSILGFTHLLRDQGYSPVNPRHREYLNIILTSGQHLLALINDILDLSKIEANQLDLQWEAIDIPTLCKTALLLVREKASDKGLALSLTIAPDLSALVADPLRLKQMLFNLLSNAIKFTLHGTIGLEVTQRDSQPAEPQTGGTRLTSVAAPAPAFLCFTVWDTGIGIAPTQLPLLFQPYSQLTHPTHPLIDRDQGTGLGLALTQKLATLHGGTVEVVSTVNQGSRFTIVLPAQPVATIGSPMASAAAEHPSPRAAEAVAAQGAPLAVASVQFNLSSELTAATQRSHYVLLVEDNPHNAKLVLTFLSKLSYELTWVQDGNEMWQALERSLPALILMDINLPGTDGLTLTQQIRADQRYAHIPVIAQTAMAMNGDRELCLDAGATDYIAKPLDLTRLRQIVNQYVREADREMPDER